MRISLIARVGGPLDPSAHPCHLCGVPRLPGRARIRALSLLIPLLLAGACRSVPSPEEVPSRTDALVSEQEGADVVERMLAVSVAGQTIGVVETRLEKAPDGTWTTHERVTFSLTRQGGGADATFETRTESVSVFDPQHEFVREVEVETEAGVTITRTIIREGDKIISRYEGPDRSFTREFELPPDYRSSLAVYFELRERYEGQPLSATYSSFSAERERFEKVEVSFLGPAEYEHGGQRLAGYHMRERSEDGTVVDTIVDENFLPLTLDASGTFTAKLVDEAPMLGGGGGGKINSELPIRGKTTPDWQELAEQQVSVEVSGDDDPQSPALWDDSHYHQVEREGERYTMTLLSTRPPKGFVAPSLPMTIDDPDVRRYLEPTPMAQSDNPAIQAVAHEIVDGETNSMVVAERIIGAVYFGIDKEAGVRGNATATEVLRNGAGDCTEHAVLVVALMRAAGIPARVVDGIVIAAEGDGSGVGGYHAWAEIWLGRWIGVDATVGETGTSARYLNFGVDEPGQIGSGGKMMRSIGKTEIELGPHKTYEELGAQP
jgi:hypothetical protein